MRESLKHCTSRVQAILRLERTALVKKDAKPFGVREYLST